MTEQDTPKMTHDEMIDTLKGLVFGTFDRTTAKEREALDMAISALSDPSANVISIDQANAMIKSYVSHYEENKGEWIEVVTERLPNGEKRMWHYECSACGMGEPPCPINKEHWDFCPNCGADMRGE